MELYTQWPVLKFADVKASILARFSAETGESVAYLLVKELVQTIDQCDGQVVSMKIGSDADLEWVMQIFNHAFSLSFANLREYETIHAAVRVYITWCSALSVEAHPSCPPTLKAHPDRYFRRMLDSMRPVFLPREADLSTPASADSGIRQAIEMQIILEGLRNLSTKIIDEYKDEVWSQLILFLLNINAQMLNDPHVFDDAHSPVANDLIGTLFSCWTTAALSEHIPSPAYWKTLTLMARKWALGQVSFIEHWGRYTLHLGAAVMAKTIKNYNCTLLSLAKNDDTTQRCPKSVSETWFKLFYVFPRPVDILLDARGDASVNTEIAGLVFYLAILTHARLVDIILGDTKVSIDFNESVELAMLWAHNRKELQDEFSKSYHQQRSSSMSTITSNNTDVASSSISGNSSIGRKHAVVIPNTLSRHSGLHRLSGRNNNFIKPPEVEKAAAPLPIAPALADFIRPKPGQFVHHYLKSNPFRQLERSMDYDLMKKFSTTALLEVFLYVLGDAAVMSESLTEVDGLKRLEVAEIGDVTSARSMSSVECDNFPASTASSGNNGDNKVTRRSFATSTASLTSDYASVYNRQTLSANVTASQSPASALSMHSVVSDTSPSMDGFAAGRAVAIETLCRIVCEKSSTEELPPTQLAQFYLILHKALVDRDRLTLCTILYYGTELFKLGLRGVEILLPNYLMAVDIIMTESLKLRLHPSISEVEMRHTCLQAIASIVAWPTTFGATAIIDETAWSRLGHGHNNVLEHKPTFLDLRQRLLRILVHVLRNESDSTNLHLALSSCAVLVAECCRYDIENGITAVSPEAASDSSSLFAISALRSIVSAICDNVAKPAWTAELTTTLAALDCLNALAGSPRAILFAGDDMSTGSLVVTSLARFIDHQLQKPPPFHSRDLHSSVVAAYSSLAVWLSTTPELAEIESCLTTVAEAIEFGLTGGRGLASVSSDSKHKPASLRVRDAADNLLNTLFNLSTSGVNGSAEIVDERTLLYKFGSDVIDTTKFRHFLINQHTLIAVYEASKLVTTAPAASLSPAVIVVTRTPYALAHSSLLQLKASTVTSGEPNDDHASENGYDGLSSSSSMCESKPPLKRVQTERRDSVDSTFEGPSDNPTTLTSAIKQFEFPPEFDRPLCQLDAAYPPFGAAPTPTNGSQADISQIVQSLESINARLAAGGGSASGERDTNNVWIQSSLGALLSEQLKPMPPVSKVNSIRNFLYDFGLLNANTFGSNLILLDSGRSDDFYRDLHQLVDRTPVRATQTVGIFYVREGQSSASEILDNALYLDETSTDFCGLLADLGECVDVTNHAHWTGHWATAFSFDRKPLDFSNDKNERYTFDGITHCLWSADSLLEVAFVMYSERSRRLNTLVNCDKAYQSTKYSSVSTKISCNNNVDAVFDDDPDLSVASWHALRAHEAHRYHRLQRQMTLFPEANNNVCCPSLPTHSSQVPQCPTVQTSEASRDFNKSMLLKSPLNHGQHHRLYVKHPHPPIGSGIKTLSRRSSLSPQFKDNAPSVVFDTSFPPKDFNLRKYSRSPHLPKKSIDRRDSLPSLMDLANENTHEANRCQSIQSLTFKSLQRRHHSKSPDHSQNNSSNAIGGIFKAFFARRGGKTPEPDVNDGIISGEKLVTGAVANPTTVPVIAVPQLQLNLTQSNGNAVTRGHRSLIRPISPDPTLSRRSDVSQHSHVSGSSSSTTANRTKSSLTIASDCGSNGKGAHSLPSIRSDKSSTSSSPKRCLDQRIFIVWLECIEDMYTFPTESFFDVSTDGHSSPSIRPDHVVLFLHPTEPGLIRVHVDGVWTKHGQPGPLVDGSVVSINALPALLRQTVASIARRRCFVEVDSLASTFSRRRHAIQDFARKYAVDGTSYVEYLDSFILT